MYRGGFCKHSSHMQKTRRLGCISITQTLDLRGEGTRDPRFWCGDLNHSPIQTTLLELTKKVQHAAIFSETLIFPIE